MDEQTARVVVGVILTLAGIVWLISVRFVAATKRIAGESQLPERISFDTPAVAGETIAGEVMIEGPPAGLACKLARVLAQPQLNPLGTVRILQASDDRVTFEQTLPMGRCAFKVGEIDFSGAGGNRTRGTYRVTASPHRGLLITAQALLVLGLSAIILCWWLMERFVISNPNDAVRWQVLQSLQVVHFLWPPFLLAALYRANRNAVIANLETLLANLPHLD